VLLRGNISMALDKDVILFFSFFFVFFSFSFLFFLNFYMVYTLSFTVSKVTSSHINIGRTNIELTWLLM